MQRKLNIEVFRQLEVKPNRITNIDVYSVSPNNAKPLQAAVHGGKCPPNSTSVCLVLLMFANGCLLYSIVLRIIFKNREEYYKIRCLILIHLLPC